MSPPESRAGVSNGNISYLSSRDCAQTEDRKLLEGEEHTSLKVLIPFSTKNTGKLQKPCKRLMFLALRLKT